MVWEIKRKGEQTLPDHALFASNVTPRGTETLCWVVALEKASTAGKPLNMWNVDVKKAHVW